MNIVKGNLIQLAIDGGFDVIVHGCNCQCRMKSGIAKAVSQTFPDAVAADNQTTPGDRSKLGTYTSAMIETESGPLHVINGYTQFNYGRHTRQVDYDALRLVFKKLKTEYCGKRIGYPKIGAGLAGGDWPTIAQIIDEELEGENYTLVVFDQD